MKIAYRLSGSVSGTLPLMSIASLSLAPNSSASLEMPVASPPYKPSSCYKYESRAARLRTAIATDSARLPIGKHGDKAGSAGINRHVVGDARGLQERRKRIHPDPESCGDRCEAIVAA